MRQTDLFAHAEGSRADHTGQVTAPQPQPQQLDGSLPTHYLDRHDVLALDDETSFDRPHCIHASQRDDQIFRSEFCTHCHVAVRLLRGCETGFQVGEDVVDGLETNRQPHEAWEYTG